MRCCDCITWCRDKPEYSGRSKNGLPLYTTHHPRCDHYNDSLIQVFKIEYEGQSCYTTEKPEVEDGEIVTETTIHREIYDQLQDFEGF